ncbi:MAG: CatA-like O-acetyltransferase [Bdellovibrionia bacterium]
MNTQRYKVIDLSTWERRNTFLCFKNFDFPISVMGCELDISVALPFWKEKGLSPFLSMVYAVCRAANSVPAFRQRIRDETVIEFECIHASFTIPTGEDSFGVKRVEFNPQFHEFYKTAKTASAINLELPSNSFPHNGISNDYENHHDQWFYLSCTPWVRFTHVVQATDRSISSIPRIIWGKFTQTGDRVLVPFSVQTHHSLVDGRHKMKFFDSLQTSFETPEDFFV